MKKDTELWLDFAKGDLIKARDNAAIPHFDLACYLSQQSAEKALKALLIEQTDDFPKTHDLIDLGRRVKLPAELMQRCRDLTQAYSEARYPFAHVKIYTKEHADVAIATAEEVLGWAIEKISSQG